MSSLRSSALIPISLIGVVLMMVIPVSPMVLDVLLAANLTFAVLVVLATVLLKDSLEFSVFPSLLLLTTITRLALNVSSTRSILVNAHAGKVIDTFGSFVIGQSVVVGLVVFLILIVIQFVVITNGAGRVAEVGARFTLDAMPGKQMAIDADLTAGLIDEAEARERRKRIGKEADFYGAMDGASKFVKGDAIASIIIVGINLFGGFAIGLGSQGLSMSDAVDTYSRLSVGDGLVSQIPALLISLATGLLVTRVGTDDDMGSELGLQLFGNPRAMRLAALGISGLAMLPGLPKVPFFAIAGALVVFSTRPSPVATEPPPDEAPPVVSADPDDPQAIVGTMRVEPLELHLSYDILDLIDATKGGDLLERVRALREQIAMDLGIVMPPVRTRDDVSLDAETYAVMLRGTKVGVGTAPVGHVLAMPVGDGAALRGLGAVETIEPVFGLTAFWVPGSVRAEAAATGATVVDRSAVVVTHLAEVVRSNAPALLSRQDVQLLVEGLRYDEPILANEVGTEHFPLSTLHAVLRRLLEERISIRDLGPIVEAVSARIAETRSLDHLTSAARSAVGHSIVGKLAPEGTLAIFTLDPAMEASMHEALRDVDGEFHLAMDPIKLNELSTSLEDTLRRSLAQPHPAALLCGQVLRRPLQKTISTLGHNLTVLAYPEIPQSIELKPLGVVGRVGVDA